MIYSSRVSRGNGTQLLAGLDVSDLSLLDRDGFNSYLYIFDSGLLSMLSPLSFAYYSKYTFEELLIIPLLVLHQKKGSLFGSDRIMHDLQISYIQARQVVLIQPQSRQNSLCFISYPNVPQRISSVDTLGYLDSIFNS